MDIQQLYTLFQACSGVSTDTRQIVKDSLFFALKGASFNGNAFAKQAIDGGCRYAVIDEPEYLDEQYPQIILVDHCLKALQDLAAEHRRRWGKTVIGITGTNGKTTTKELIAAVLQMGYDTLYTQGNLNNHIGVPLTLLQLKPHHEIAVIEMGANHPGEIADLANIAQPDYGIITNVGKAHLEGFGSFEGVIKTKGELYDYLRTHGKQTIFLRHEDEHLTSIAGGLTTIEYGTGEGLFVSGVLADCAPYLAYHWTHEGETFHVQTQLIGTYNLPNALAATAIGIFFGITPQEINVALRRYTPKNNRSQLTVKGDNRWIVDAYNANPTSMLAALDNFSRITGENKVAILGDMKELGESTAEEHQRIVDYLKTLHLSRIYLVGEVFSRTRHPFRSFPDASALLEALQKEPLHQSLILLKGSNSIKLTTVIENLED